MATASLATGRQQIQRRAENILARSIGVLCPQISMSFEISASRRPLDPSYDSQPMDVQPRTSDSAAQGQLALSSSGSAAAGLRSSRFSPAEWLERNRSVLRQAAAQRRSAQRLTLESRSVQAEAEERTLRSQARSTQRLGERLEEIHARRSELQRHVELVAEETELLVALRRRLEKALDASETPMIISTHNLTCREGRIGPDLVKDTVEDELIKEVELIQSVQALLKRTLTQVIDQIRHLASNKLYCASTPRSNREVKTMLELDWSDKSQAYSMDDCCAHYSNGSMDTQFHPISAKLHEHASDHESWAKFTHGNLVQSDRAQKASAELRLLAERVLQETAEDLHAQAAAVDLALAHRCREVSEAKVQLELHLSQTQEQISAQERSIVALEQTLRNKEAPLRVAQSRLHHRARRPNVELCRDDPQISLVAEVDELERTLETLRRQLSESRRSLECLEETRLTLVKDIANKTHSLLIDGELCTTHRTRYPTATTLAGY
ncbi:tektin-4-like [Scleropages formosus]|uniref:Tektin n=1 Tax=Scleropages formosus TaxID=113540 RepID=A0A0P7XEY9_SCLFO|nr:tektin-4-like [Scleropages formosus]